MNPRRSPKGFRGPPRPLTVVSIATAVLMLSACASGSGESTTTVAPSVRPISTSTTASSTSITSPSTTTTSAPPTEAVVEAWSAYWEAWAQVRASADLAPEPLEAVASQEVVEGAVALFERQRSSGLEQVDTEFVLHPTVIASEGATATLEDCVLLMPSFTEAVGVWYEADLTWNDDGWTVDALRVQDTVGCVPSELAEAAIAGYEAFYDGWEEFWDPADPDSRIIDDVLAEPQRSLVYDLLVEHQDRGVALRGRPTTHPEVIEVRSPTELVILSCLEPATDYGVYDIETGERLEDVEPVEDGQRNLESAVMVFEDGAWKISDIQGQVDFACDFAPTDRGLPPI